VKWVLSLSENDFTWPAHIS